MVDKEQPGERWAFVDKIQDWFERKRQFWLVISVLTFSSVLILEAIFIFASQTNPKSDKK